MADKIPLDSFTFNGKNSLTDYNIKITYVDVLLPKKRPRKINLPRQHGAYDLGSLYYDEREITVSCVWENPWIDEDGQYFDGYSQHPIKNIEPDTPANTYVPSPKNTFR